MGLVLTGNLLDAISVQHGVFLRSGRVIRHTSLIWLLLCIYLVCPSCELQGHFFSGLVASSCLGGGRDGHPFLCVIATDAIDTKCYGSRGPMPAGAEKKKVADIEATIQEQSVMYLRIHFMEQ